MAGLSDDWDEGEGGDDETATLLGPCCICGGLSKVRTIVMLSVKGAVPGHGWACVVCGLPPDGASAVLCDGCVGDYSTSRKPLRFVCRGYPASEGRMAIADLSDEPHRHDPAVEH